MPQGGDNVAIDPLQLTGEATGPVLALRAGLDETVTDLGRLAVATAVADAPCALAGRAARRAGPIDLRAAKLAREYLAVRACEQTPAAALEHITGTDRFTLARPRRSLHRGLADGGNRSVADSTIPSCSRELSSGGASEEVYAVGDLVERRC